MYIRLIRHGQTPGNRKRKFIGCRTDESLAEEGRRALQKEAPLRADYWVISPMKRCLETAEILNGGYFPAEGTFETAYDLRECDFGDFEYKSNDELTGNPAYQCWIDSGGLLPFPGGESRDSCACRCCASFEKICRRLLEREKEKDKEKEKTGTFTVNFVVHGGTVMSIAEKYGRKPDGYPYAYYDAYLKNGEWLYGCMDENRPEDGRILLHKSSDGPEKKN